MCSTRHNTTFFWSQYCLCIHLLLCKMHCCLGDPHPHLHLLHPFLAAAQVSWCSSSMRTRQNQRGIQLWDSSLPASTMPCLLRVYQWAGPVIIASAPSPPALCCLEFPWWRIPWTQRQVFHWRAGPEPLFFCKIPSFFTSEKSLWHNFYQRCQEPQRGNSKWKAIEQFGDSSEGTWHWFSIECGWCPGCFSVRKRWPMLLLYLEVVSAERRGWRNWQAWAVVGINQYHPEKEGMEILMELKEGRTYLPGLEWVKCLGPWDLLWLLGCDMTQSL